MSTLKIHTFYQDGWYMISVGISLENRGGHYIIGFFFYNINILISSRRGLVSEEPRAVIVFVMMIV